MTEPLVTMASDRAIVSVPDGRGTNLALNSGLCCEKHELHVILLPKGVHGGTHYLYKCEVVLAGSSTLCMVAARLFNMICI